MFIQDPNFSILDLGSKIFRIPDPDPHKSMFVKYFNPKNCFYALGNMIRMFIWDPDLDLFTNPGSLGQKGTGSLIRITVSI
jgi:hypothetical protein